MLKRLGIRRSATAFAVLVAILFLPGTVLGEDAKKYREQITQYSQKIVDLRARATEAADLMEDLSKTQGWLDEALVQVGKEEFTAVKAFLRRVEVQLDYVEAQADWREAKATADQRESELKELRSKLGKLQAELEELKSKENELQTKMSTAQGGK